MIATPHCSHQSVCKNLGAEHNPVAVYMRTAETSGLEAQARRPQCSSLVAPEHSAGKFATACHNKSLEKPRLSPPGCFCSIPRTAPRGSQLTISPGSTTTSPGRPSPKPSITRPRLWADSQCSTSETVSVSSWLRSGITCMMAVFSPSPKVRSNRESPTIVTAIPTVKVSAASSVAATDTNQCFILN